MTKKAHAAQTARAAHSKAAAGITTRHNAINQALAQIDLAHTRNRKLLGIPTGFHRLDELLGGWRAGQTIVLAARPDHGKTALALTFACHALKKRYDPTSKSSKRPGHPIGIFSLDLTKEELMLRLLAAEGSESLMRITHGYLEERSRKKLRMVADDLKAMPLFLNDSTHLSIDVLRVEARRMKDCFKIEMLIIDNLDLLSFESAQSRGNRQDSATNVSRAIKALARELGIPILLLVELNEPSKEQRRVSTPHQLLELGVIEKNADVVLLLSRSFKAKERNQKKLAGPVFPYTLDVAKHRHGPTDSVNILFHAAYTRFDDPREHVDSGQAEPDIKMNRRNK